MKAPLNSMTVTFDSRSVNEGFARVCAASSGPAGPHHGRAAVSEAVTNAIVRLSRLRGKDHSWR